ncbi:MAG: hypothetical protein M1821_009889 [Bathelium mastoideum]|nr:MAG: hypothetical protein M1821_009889 [Bathelium mastoideum]KAI9690349.1 MAG: hypothetical protein M1822_009311 [Bathelium mastoideum]
MSNKISAGEDGADVVVDNGEHLPPLAAAFLVLFDLKVGYSIAWQRSLPDIELDGTVEYKSLPSGLHNVKEDLIYFTHGDYAGISAFVSGAAAQSERNARLVAVGILVPLSYGRLGQGWLHTQYIRELAAHIAKNTRDTKPLEDYWNRYHADGKDIPDLSRQRESLGSMSYSNGSLPRRKSRAYSNAAGLEQSLHPAHPARSILRFLDTFGPLAFPLYRAALLRKRILILAEPPVRETCNFVYDLSIISTIPSSAADVLFSNSHVKDLPLRFRALFSVGVHDIPQLSATATTPHQQQGWVACSTDEVLAMKTQLYDIVVELPQGYASASSKRDQHREWPTIKTSNQKPLKATQRDLRRYRTLRQDLRTLTDLTLPTPARSPQPRRVSPATLPTTATSSSFAHPEESPDTEPLLRSGSSHPTPATNNREHHNGSHRDTQGGDNDNNDSTKDEEQNDDHEDDDDDTTLAPITEPRTWSALAYASFLWWASAGERAHPSSSTSSSSPSSSPHDEDEEAADRALFAATVNSTAGPALQSPRSQRRGSSGAGRRRSMTVAGGVELGLVAYFQGMTAGLVEGLAGVVAREVGEEEGEGEDVSTRDWAHGHGQGHGGEEGGEEAATEDGSVEGGEEVHEEELEPVTVGADDLAKLGLDSWSAADKAFVEEVVPLWFGREADVKTSGIECCGVRIL